jgi:hypothetical protein
VAEGANEAGQDQDNEDQDANAASPADRNVEEEQ